MKPTTEQQAAIDLFADGKRLAIEAGAGTGKTTTLRAIAESTDRVGSYVAFNRAIVNEAKEKMPMTVTSSTAHALAMRQVGGDYRHRLDSDRVPSARLARMLDVGALVVTKPSGERKVLQPAYLASLVMRGIRSFCMTDDVEPTGRHLPYIDAIDARDAHGARTFRNNDLVRRELTPAIERAWTDLADPVGRLPFSHDHYLKLWELGEPRIPGDYVLFDEAQDASPVMLSAVAKNAARGAQVVFVGDTQQQIYEWRGAVNALATVPADARTLLTQSFRFGPAIADVANAVLDALDADLRLVGLPSIQSRVTGVAHPEAILCRSNSAAVSTVLALQKAGRHPHLVGGATDVVRFAKAVGELQETGRTYHPDLACFDSWAEVIEYVSQDPQGDDLSLMVKLVEEYGVQIIVDALDGMIAERSADVIVSTAHKSKGREWGTVRLAGDFADPEQRGEGGNGEWRLMYVAATRAQRDLDLRMCEPLADLVGIRPALAW